MLSKYIAENHSGTYRVCYHGAGYYYTTTFITDLVDDRRTNTVIADQADGKHRNLLRGAYLFEQVQVKCIVVVAEVDDRVRVVRVMVQSYPVEGRPAVGHTARYGVRSTPVYGRHWAGDIRVRNAWENDKVFCKLTEPVTQQNRR